MWMFKTRSGTWWYWRGTVGLLLADVPGRPIGLMLAIGIATLKLVQYAVRERQLVSLPLQVRFGYLLLLLIALPEPLRWMYGLVQIGTGASVRSGYRPISQAVSLLPWNREFLRRLEPQRRITFPFVLSSPQGVSKDERKIHRVRRTETP